MAFITKNFLMTSDDPEKEEWARLYTLPTFELSKGNIHLPVLHYIEEEEKWAYRVASGRDILLTKEEVIRFIGCRMCGKSKINNWKRYCDCKCPYYFITPALKEII